MKVLAIETATAVCGAAVVENGKVLSERSLSIPHVHSEKIMTLIDAVLHEANIEIRSLDGIAVSSGPGSFTGLRIGVSTAKGLAFAAGLNITTVSTLEGLAWNVGGDDEMTIIPLIQARRNEVYAGAYRFRNGMCECLHSPELVAIAKVSEQFAEYPDAVLIGDGAEQVYNNEHNMKHDHSMHWKLSREEMRGCSAGSVGIAGERQLKQGRTADAAALEPVYLQEPYVTPLSQAMVQS